MEIKIQLPNPDDYQYANGVTDWFSQMRISLKAAEKTYQEATKDLTDEEKENYFVDIGVPYELQEQLLKGTTVDGLYSVNKGKTTDDFIQENLYVKIWSA